MPDYNLGRAHGTIRVDYEGDGAKRAREDVKDLGDEAKTTATKIDQSAKQSETSIKRVGQTAKSTKVVPEVDRSAFQQLVTNIQSIDKSTKKSASGINLFSGRLKVMIAGVALASPGVAGLGVSLASLAGLAGVAAGALGGLAATASTLVVGMQGIGTVFKEAAAQTKAAGAGAAASANAQRAAAKAIESAKRSLRDAEENLRDVQEDAARAAIQAARQVVSAQRDLIDAQRDAVRAQQALSRARQEAVRELEDMRSALTGGAFDERQAVLDLKRAQEELAAIQADPTASDREREQAILNLERQQFALEETRKENQRLAVDQAAAAAAGVAGSEQVVNAQDNVRDSAQAVRDAQEGLADAQENVRRTQVESSRAIRDAVEQITVAQEALAEAYIEAADQAVSAGARMADAMADLSPNARAFVQAVLDQRSAWDALRKSVQDRLFGDLAKDVAPLARTWFPLLQEAMGGVADSLNGMIDGVVEFAKASETQDNVRQIFSNTSQALGEMRNVLRDLLFAFLDIVTVGSDFLPGLGRGAADAAADFREFISAARESGSLRQWMQDAMNTTSEFWELLKNLGSIIKSVFTGLDQAGGGALGTLTELTGKIDEFLKSAEGQEALQALGSVLRSIGGAYGKVFMSFLETVADLLVAVEPLVVAFADAVGIYLAGFFQGIGAILQPFADFLGFIGPVLGPVIAGVYAFNKAIGFMALAFRGLNTVMKANVFVLVASLIAALVILIIENWETISAKLGAIWQGIQDAAAVAWLLIQQKIIDPIVNTWNRIVELWDNITTAFVIAGRAIGTKVSEVFNGIKSTITNALNTAKEFVRQRLSDIGTFFRELPGKILGFLRSLPGSLANWAVDLINGIVRGLGSMAYRIWQKLKEIVSDAWDSVLDFFGISSPSKLAIEAMQEVGAGMIKGLESMKSGVSSAATHLSDAAAGALTGATGNLAATVAVGADLSALPGNVALAGAVPLTAAPNGGAEGTKQGTTIIIDNLTLQVAGNLDPTNPTAFRQTIVRLKEAIRSVDREYV